jgi:hypothetical protein
MLRTQVLDINREFFRPLQGAEYLTNHVVLRKDAEAKMMGWNTSWPMTVASISSRGGYRLKFSVGLQGIVTQQPDASIPDDLLAR